MLDKKIELIIHLTDKTIPNLLTSSRKCLPQSIRNCPA